MDPFRLDLETRAKAQGITLDNTNTEFLMKKFSPHYRTYRSLLDTFPEPKVLQL